VTRVEIHKELCDGLSDLYQRKNSDYGDSYSKLRAKYPESICIRLEDKLSRLEQLMKPGYEAKVQSESISDTLRDLANYALMELTEMRYEAKETSENVAPIVENLPDSANKNEWVPIWALGDDGKTEFYNQEIALSDAEIWYNTLGKFYTLSIEEAIKFPTADALADWLDNIEMMLFRFVNLKEPDTTYDLTWQDGFNNADSILGHSLRECAEKFSFYADNIIRHFKEKEEYGL